MRQQQCVDVLKSVGWTWDGSGMNVGWKWNGCGMDLGLKLD